jgi:hypothetical protein
MTDTPEWTMGVLDDGLAVLRDGEMVEIADVVDFLNDAEQTRVERIQLLFACGYPMPADMERHVLPTNPFKCGICDARSVVGDEKKLTI